jgi:hypothetical protein
VAFVFECQVLLATVLMKKQQCTLHFTSSWSHLEMHHTLRKVHDTCFPHPHLDCTTIWACYGKRLPVQHKEASACTVVCCVLLAVSWLRCALVVLVSTTP